MGKPFLLQLSSVLVQQRDLLKLGMVIDSYNDHCSAPFSPACWLAYAPPTLLGSGSRHCHGINYTQNPGSGPTLEIVSRPRRRNRTPLKAQEGERVLLKAPRPVR